MEPKGGVGKWTQGLVLVRDTFVGESPQTGFWGACSLLGGQRKSSLGPKNLRAEGQKEQQQWWHLQRAVRWCRLAWSEVEEEVWR